MDSCRAANHRCPASIGRPSPSGCLLVLMAALLAAPTPSRADFDPPGPGEIEAWPLLEEVQLLTDEDDGLFGFAEVVIEARLVYENPDPPTRIQTFVFVSNELSIDDLDPVRPLSVMFREDECAPPSVIRARVFAYEIDFNFWQNVFARAGAGLLGAGITAGVISLSSGTLTPLAPAIAGVITGSLVGEFLSNRSIEDLGDSGQILAALPVGSSRTFQLIGDDGGADVTLRYDTFTGPFSSPNCPPPPTEQEPEPPPPLVPEEKAEEIFQPLRDGIDEVGLLEPEPGNPAGIDSQTTIDQIREHAAAVLVGIGEHVATSVIEKARSFAGVGTAAATYDASRSTTDSTTRLNQLEDATRLAFQAILGNAPAVLPIDLVPLRLSLLAESIAIATDEVAELAVSVHGSSGVAGNQLLVTPAGPFGAALETTLADPGEPIVYTVSIDTEDTPPGYYTLDLTTSEGPFLDTRSVEVYVFEPLPAPSAPIPVPEARIPARLLLGLLLVVASLVLLVRRRTA